MSIIDRILGRTPAEGPQIQAPGRTQHTARVAEAAANAPPPASAPAPQREMVRVYDQFGRAVTIGRESWRKDVLLPNLAANRHQPDALHDLIASALKDDFAADALESARWLADHDREPRRGANLLAVVLLQLKDPAGARIVLERAIERHGANAHLLANLARALAALGDDDAARQLIWRALALDPNEPSALHWLIASFVALEDGNAATAAIAAIAAYTRVATLPGSWRAQLWLARDALGRGDLAAATRLYEESLARAQPVPADLLMQMSGDLGNQGHLELLLRLTQPRFDPALHGLIVGNNLMRACLELGMLAQARKLLEQLYSQQRPDWREPLMEWERRLDDAQKRYGEVSEPLEIELVCLEQPVWARGVLGFEALLPAKPASAPRIHFICGSGEADVDTGGKVISQPTNDLGRLARALPMFFAEEVFLGTQARSAFLLPWHRRGGFVLSARPWTRALLPPDQASPDLFVFLHVDARKSPWLIRVSIEDPQRDASAEVFEQAFAFANAGRDMLSLLNDLMSRLTTRLALRREQAGASLAMPPPELLPGYLTGLEQALAIGLAARHPGGENFLYQERAIFDHLFDVALQGAQLLRPRLLLVNALENETRRRPDIVREYLAKLALLQRQHAPAAGRGRELVEQGVQTLVQKAAAA